MNHQCRAFPGVLLLLLLVLAIRAVLADPPSAALPNGVAAGDLRATAAVLWCHSTNLGPVRFEYGADAEFGTIQGQAVTNVLDPERPVKVMVEGLSAGRSYFYRATDAAGYAKTGKFRTPWLPGRFHGLRFGVSGDWRGELIPYPAIANAAGRDLDFFVALGDTVYADVPSPAVPAPQARTLEEFRAKHNEVYSARYGLNALGDLRGSTAVFAMIDDHEVMDDFAGGAPPYSDNRFNSTGAFINESELYRAGLEAFREYNPTSELTYDTPDDPRTDQKPKLYRNQPYGSDAALFLLDTRSFRDAPLPEVANPLNPDEVKAFYWRSFDLDPNSGASLPRRTLLGARQLADLKADLLRAQADGILWKFVLVPEPIQNLGFADGPDRFEGYASERTELLRFMVENRIGNVVFISADIHGTVVNNINYQLGPEQPHLPAGAFEVVTGAVAYDKAFAPTAFDAAARIQVLPGTTLLDALLNYIDVPSREAFDALPRAEKDRLFQSLMDVQLTTIGLDPTGLENSDIKARLLEGGYVAAHTYGWTEFEIHPTTHVLTVTTYGLAPYSADQIDASIVERTPEVVSRFSVEPKPDAQSYPALAADRVGNRVRLSWPAAATGFVLQSTAELTAEANWSDVTESPAAGGDQRVFEVDVSGATRFFRLRRSEEATETRGVKNGVME